MRAGVAILEGRAQEQLIRECMANQGFEYRIAPALTNEAAQPADVNQEVRSGLPSERQDEWWVAYTGNDLSTANRADALPAWIRDLAARADS